MKRSGWVVLLVSLLGLLAAPAMAHEARPGYLQLHQSDAETYDVLWKVPGLGEDKRLALNVEFASGTTTIDPLHVSFANNAFVQRWRVQRAGGLDGTSIRIAGLQATLTDVLVRLEKLDGTTQTIRVTPASPEFVIEASPGYWEVARTYVGLGVEHILLGFDHLLFVLALLMLVRGGKRIVLSVTAFTVAHSITLAAATLGSLALPGTPVEATIALSIVFLGREIAMAWRGQASLTERMPWLVAFVFGLLHGLGFAGALAEIGLPQNAIPLALLCFNIGVEIGQLLFVGAVLAVVMVSRRWLDRMFRMLRWLPPYAIGGIASYWVIARVAAFAN
jgi:hydrogenase/urease accessory protein HupE